MEYFESQYSNLSINQQGRLVLVISLLIFAVDSHQNWWEVTPFMNFPHLEKFKPYLCVYVCMCVYIYVCVHVCVYVFVYVCMIFLFFCLIYVSVLSVDKSLCLSIFNHYCKLFIHVQKNSTNINFHSIISKSLLSDLREFKYLFFNFYL